MHDSNIANDYLTLPACMSPYHVQRWLYEKLAINIIIIIIIVIPACMCSWPMHAVACMSM